MGVDYRSDVMRSALGSSDGGDGARREFVAVRSARIAEQKPKEANCQKVKGISSAYEGRASCFQG